MKTNHRRGFKAKTHSRAAMKGWSGRSKLSGKSFHAGVGNDFSGSRGERRAVKGAKKFIRTRIRASEKRVVKAALRDMR